MKILILNNCVPFIVGGAEHLAASLERHLREKGHQAAVIRIPFSWQPPDRIVDHILASRLINVQGSDLVIGLKFPAYCVPHSNKVLWLLHQFRQAYDLWGTPFGSIPDTPEGRRIRATVIEADDKYLPQAKRIYTLSHVTGDRLKRFNALDSEVLYHPLDRPDQFFCDGYSDYVFYPSRITAGKRQALVVESMKYVTTPVRLVVAGYPETPSDREAVERVIREQALEGRVDFLPHFISEKEKAVLFSKALGCVYTPYDEDSYGYVTLEAYHSRKPVITCRDSGGTLILVRDGHTGLVSDPTPAALAESMDKLYENRKSSVQMGEAGYERMMALGINWDTVIERLTS